MICVGMDRRVLHVLYILLNKKEIYFWNSSPTQKSKVDPLAFSHMILRFEYSEKERRWYGFFLPFLTLWSQGLVMIGIRKSSVHPTYTVKIILTQDRRMRSAFYCNLVIFTKVLESSLNFKKNVKTKQTNKSKQNKLSSVWNLS